MIQYNQLNEEEQNKIRENAMNWFKEHKKHVYSLVDETKDKVAPSGSDLYHPELWKGIHWRWFLDNSFLL